MSITMEIKPCAQIKMNSMYEFDARNLWSVSKSCVGDRKICPIRYSLIIHNLHL